MADDDYDNIGGYAGIKAYVRAKWETTQFLLDKAGMSELQLYRGISLDPEKYAQADREKVLELIAMIRRQMVEGHAKVPNLNVVRNGAASTSNQAGRCQWLVRQLGPRGAARQRAAHGGSVDPGLRHQRAERAGGRGRGHRVEGVGCVDQQGTDLRQGGDGGVMAKSKPIPTRSIFSTWKCRKACSTGSIPSRSTSTHTTLTGGNGRWIAPMRYRSRAARTTRRNSGSRPSNARPGSLQKAGTAYIRCGMKTITQEFPQADRAAANSSAAADQKVLASLPAEDRKLVASLLADYPELSAEKALAMLNEAGM